ncbi:MAG: hypothetical protein QOD06_1436, partial [Candidatus Binatota bacterium]|nr:hypothetical protein [Candidatus Binatota bacterium]
LLGTALANARLVEQAVDAARLKSAFLANMSHEIRTPLNVILGYNQLVADYLEGLGDPSQRPFLDGVTQAGRRLLATIHAVLDMSRIETESFEVHPTPVNVADVAARHVEDLGAIAREKGLSLECRIEAADAIVRCDEYCLTNAIMNLIGNALKFTERGSIVVSVRRDDAANVLLEVVDTGIGIDPEFTPRLFDAFTQERSGYGRTFEGSGLGLALTRRYVEMNGGTISVESRKGEGSTFRIRFPPEIPAA